MEDGSSRETGRYRMSKINEIFGTTIRAIPWSFVPLYGLHGKSDVESGDYGAENIVIPEEPVNES